jgi:hypothetical protein
VSPGFVQLTVRRILEAPVRESVEHRRGSAQIALDVNPQFDFLLFVESNPNYADALRDLAARRLQRRIVVAEDDANSALKKMVSANSWHDKRAVVFLDPYGMEVEWSTLQALASTQAIDVWFLFPLAGLYRQAMAEPFAHVLKPLALPVEKNPQMFSLFLCISNPAPKAIGLATRIGSHLLDPKRHIIVSSTMK